MFKWLKSASVINLQTLLAIFLFASFLLLILRACGPTSHTASAANKPVQKQETEISQSASRETGAIKVEVAQREGHYLLLRGGKPYVIKGAGLVDHMQSLAQHGANSFRTWSLISSGANTEHMLNEAHHLGLTVSLGVYVGSERHGFDFDDQSAIDKQLNRIKQAVTKYRNHPALLTWIIGNELNHDMKDRRVYEIVEGIAAMIKSLDPNHPTTTTVAGFNGEMGRLVSELAPSIDFLSIQLYGDLVKLPQFISKARYNKPYMVTEWGAVGHWEVGKTEWGAPIEHNSSMKAANYLSSYETAIAPYPQQIIGSYVFLWGQKQERTPTWYGMYTKEGERTEAVDVMHSIWNGRWPENRTPAVLALSLNGQSATDSIKLKAGKTYEAQLKVSDPEQGSLRYRWQLMHESTASQVGGDRELIPEELTGLIQSGASSQIVLRAPAESGAYRLFAYATDDYNSAAHANVPFYVSP